jgi:hypothetical protein
MKKSFTLYLLFISSLSAAFAQNIVKPRVAGSDDYATRITSIETNKQYTIVSFESFAAKNDSWFQVNKEIFLQTDQSNAHYGYVKSEGITVAPERSILKKAGDKLNFKIYFRKIPAETKVLDVIERAGKAMGVTYFNFYNVSLTEQANDDNLTVTDVVLTPPVPQDFENTENIMNGMLPMFSEMTKGVMDAQVEYYKQPGKIEELAKLHKQYYKALRKEGFTADEALKIITSEGIMPRPSTGK